MPPYHHRFSGPVAPHMHHIYKGLSPPVAFHPHHWVKGPFPYKFKAPCPTRSDPTVPATPVARLPTEPEPTVLPTLPATTAAPLTTTMPAVVTTVETSAPVTLLVSTHSGLITTVSPVETGRILPVRFASPHKTNNAPRCFQGQIFVSLWPLEPLKIIHAMFRD